MCIYTSKITLGKPAHLTQRVLTRDVYLHQKNACTTARLLCICVHTSPRKRGIKQANRARGASSGISWASGTLRDWGPFPPLAPFPLSNLFNSLLLLLGGLVCLPVCPVLLEREKMQGDEAHCASQCMCEWKREEKRLNKEGKGEDKGERKKKRKRERIKEQELAVGSHTPSPPAVTQTSLQPPYKQLRHLWPQTHNTLTHTYTNSHSLSLTHAWPLGSYWKWLLKQTLKADIRMEFSNMLLLI